MKTSHTNHMLTGKQSVFIYLILLLPLLIGWLTQKPSSHSYQNNDLTQFSQSRALELLKPISLAPHYTTSEYHSNVRDFIVTELEAIGLDVSIQKTLATSSKRYRSNGVSNIIGILPASSNTNIDRKALALVSHYDSSTNSSLGASDAGSGVVTILESLRAFVAANQQRQNDIFVIITDAEEQGLMGAEAFVKEHPLTKRIGLVLNFEARGSGGPAYMFVETNKGNRALIEAFSDAGVDYPQANSLMYSIYKMLPNDTDLTIFKEQGGIQGFNFAFIDDHYDYHTVQDSFERLDRSTLNHQASYLTAMLPVFANIDLATLYNEADDVYFNVANWGVVNYPFTWVIPMCLLAILAFVVLTGIGLKRNQISIKNALIGFVPAITSVICVSVLGIYGWQMSTSLFPYLTEIPQGFTYNGHWIIAFTIILSSILTFTLYQWFSRKFHNVSTTEFLIAPIILWLIINTLFAIYLVGAGFFIITLVAPLAMLAFYIWDANTYTRKLWLSALMMAPALLIITPQIPVFVIGLGLSNLVIAAILTSLLLLTAMPLLLQTKGKSTINALLTVALLISIVGIIEKSGYNSEQKKPNNINYVYDTQSEQAYFFSYTENLDDFTGQFFNERDTEQQALRGIYPTNRRNRPYYIASAPTLALEPTSYNASINPLNDTKGHYQFDISIEPNRPISNVQIASNLPLKINQMAINGQAFARSEIRTRAGFIFRHLFTDEETISVSIKFESEIVPEFRLIGTNFDLATQLPNFKPRSESFS